MNDNYRTAIGAIFATGAFILLFHLVGWMHHLDERLDLQAQMVVKQSSSVLLYEAVLKKQKEVDQLKADFNELLETAEGMKAYIIWLEEKLDERNLDGIPPRHRKIGLVPSVN